jgi:phosphoglycerate dehydrogenase-like enzyme
MPAASKCILAHVPVRMLAAIAEEFPDFEFVHVPTEGAVPPDVAGEVLLTFTWGSPNLRDVLARGVRWVHTLGTGIDRFPIDALGDRTLTCARGASAVPMSEWTLAMMLAFEKQLPGTWLSEPPESWNSGRLGGLYGRTLGIVGLGGIGEAIAARAECFGMRVRAIRRSPRPGGRPGVEIAPSLDDLLESADHLVLVAPATAATRHLIGRNALAKIKTGVHLVNISRGSLIDQDALREALDAGRVARASLDVADPEPLPAGHWLYSHPRVFLSPHVSWSMPGSIQILLETFAGNLRRHVAGEELEGVVDLEAGY